MFQLSETEFQNLRCQIGTSSSYGGRRYLPFVFIEQGVGFKRFAVTAKNSGPKTFPLRSRPSMTFCNRTGAGKSRRGPGRRSRLGWGPLLFRASRYLNNSTGSAAGKGFTEEILSSFPCGEPRGGGWCLQIYSERKFARIQGDSFLFHKLFKISSECLLNDFWKIIKRYWVYCLKLIVFNKQFTR